MWFAGSGYYSPEVWDYLKAQKKPADLFSFDTTLCYEDCGFKSTHMGAPEVIRLKEELEALGIVDKHTHCVMNHFSHSGGNNRRFPVRSRFQARS